jgi:hypothetical protein
MRGRWARQICGIGCTVIGAGQHVQQAVQWGVIICHGRRNHLLDNVVARDDGRIGRI